MKEHCSVGTLWQDSPSCSGFTSHLHAQAVTITMEHHPLDKAQTKKKKKDVFRGKNENFISVL